MFFTDKWYGLLLTITLRYFIIAGLAYLIWYKIIRSKVAFKKIQTLFETPGWQMDKYFGKPQPASPVF